VCSAPAFHAGIALSMGEISEHDGGSPILFQHLLLVLQHPEVILCIPAFSAISDLVAGALCTQKYLAWLLPDDGVGYFGDWRDFIYRLGAPCM
jgi:cytochrome c oxidase subunit 1